MSSQSVNIRGSTAIDRIEYDDQSRVLTVHMQPGTKGQSAVSSYMDVPKEVFEEFVKADSHGKFYNTRIREHYPFLG